MRVQGVTPERPYLLMGETRRRALAGHIRTCVERWRRAWAATEDTSVAVEMAESTSRVSELRLHDVICVRGITRADAQELTLVVPGRCVPHLLGLQGDAPDAAWEHPEEHTLAGQLELEALRRLVGELVGRSEESIDVQRVTTPLAAVLRECEGARVAVALIGLGDMKSPLIALLSMPLAAAMLPARALVHAAEPIERRRQAVARELVVIEAVLGHAEVSIADVAGLVIGDVIILENALGATGSIVIPGSGPIAAVMPGQLDGKRAVQVKGAGNA